MKIADSPYLSPMIKYLVAIGLFACVGCNSSAPNEKAATTKQDTLVNKDTLANRPVKDSPYDLVDRIQHDKQFHVQVVQFDNGVIKIAADSPNKQAAQYFMDAYRLDSFSNVKGCEVYGMTNAIANPNKRKPVSVVMKKKAQTVKGK